MLGGVHGSSEPDYVWSGEHTENSEISPYQVLLWCVLC